MVDFGTFMRKIEQNDQILGVSKWSFRYYNLSPITIRNKLLLITTKLEQTLDVIHDRWHSTVKRHYSTLNLILINNGTFCCLYETNDLPW